MFFEYDEPVIESDLSFDLDRVDLDLAIKNHKKRKEKQDKVKSKLKKKYDERVKEQDTRKKLMDSYSTTMNRNKFFSNETVLLSGVLDSFHQSVKNLLADPEPSAALREEVLALKGSMNPGLWLIKQLGEMGLTIPPRKAELLRVRVREKIYNPSTGKYDLPIIEVFLRVWNRIIGLEDEEIKKNVAMRLFEELYDGSRNCTSGYKIRLVNSLCGFFPDIHVANSENETMSQIAIVCKKQAAQKYPSDSTKQLFCWAELMRKKFTEMGISEDKMETWIDPVYQQKEQDKEKQAYSNACRGLH